MQLSMALPAIDKAQPSKSTTLISAVAAAVQDEDAGCGVWGVN